MNIVFLLMGGNLGNVKKHFEDAAKLLQQNYCAIIQSSSIYDTEAWGKVAQPNYLNQALKIETQKSATEILNLLHKIETSLGRVRLKKWESRTIDIDILFFNREIINENNLIIPHPLIAKRRFVLVALNEIASDFIHPVLNKTIFQLSLECEDNLSVKKIW